MVTPGKVNKRFLLLFAQPCQDEGVQIVAIQGALGVKSAHVNSPSPLHLHKQQGPDFKLHLGISITLAKNSRSPLMLHNTPKYPPASQFPAFLPATEFFGYLNKTKVFNVLPKQKNKLFSLVGALVAIMVFIWPDTKPQILQAPNQDAKKCIQSLVFTICNT